MSTWADATCPWPLHFPLFKPKIRSNFLTTITSKDLKWRPRRVRKFTKPQTVISNRRNSLALSYKVLDSVGPGDVGMLLSQ